MSHRRPLRILACCAGLLGVRLAGAEFHVAPHGSDAAPGTAAAPFATVQRAQAAAARAGLAALGPGVITTGQGARRSTPCVVLPTSRS